MLKLIMTTVLALFVAGCSVASRGYDFSVMPKYDKAVADAKWEVISALEDEFNEIQVNMMLTSMAGAQPTESEIDQLRLLYDEYVYWKSVAEVQVFHGEYESASKSAAHSSKALSGMDKIVDAAAGRASF